MLMGLQEAPGTMLFLQFCHPNFTAVVKKLQFTDSATIFCMCVCCACLCMCVCLCVCIWRQWVRETSLMFTVNWTLVIHQIFNFYGNHGREADVSKTWSMGRTLATTLYPNICTDIEKQHWEVVWETIVKGSYGFPFPICFEMKVWKVGNTEWMPLANATRTM